MAAGRDYRDEGGWSYTWVVKAAFVFQSWVKAWLSRTILLLKGFVGRNIVFFSTLNISLSACGAALYFRGKS